MNRREQLDKLTDRWRSRHEARRPAPDARPPASVGRQVQAAAAFPYRSVAAASYVDAHGAAMRGFTFDEERYADPELDAWLLEVRRLLRERR